MRNDKRNRQLGTEADFWKAYGAHEGRGHNQNSQAAIPRHIAGGRAAVREIIEENLTDYINDIDFNIK